LGHGIAVLACLAADSEAQTARARRSGSVTSFGIRSRTVELGCPAVLFTGFDVVDSFICEHDPSSTASKSISANNCGFCRLIDLPENYF
jgi:hypothetical protein